MMKIESNYGKTTPIINENQLIKYLDKTFASFMNEFDEENPYDVVYEVSLYDENNNKLSCYQGAIGDQEDPEPLEWILSITFADETGHDSISNRLSIETIQSAFTDFFSGGTQWTSLFEDGAIVISEAPTQKSSIKIKYKREKPLEVHGDQVEQLDEMFDSEDEIKAALKEIYDGTCCPECSSHQFEANNFIVPYAKASIFREVVKKGFFGSKYENEHVADTWIPLDPYLNHGGMFDAGYLKCKNCGWEVTTKQDSNLAGNLLAGAIATWGALSTKGSR